MGGSEDVSTMDLKETELTLSLPGEKTRYSGGNTGFKRGFSDTLDLNLGGVSLKGKKFEVIDDELEHPDAPKPSPPKAQIVGWPPVRASRKNAMKSCKYVKVGADGAPYLRKLDLQLHSNYQHLFLAFQQMFSCYTIRKFYNDGKLLDHVNGSEYVPTYEDKDGDWMMVGDGPWNMFVESCKRIRLMKSADAVGLESRTIFKIE